MKYFWKHVEKCQKRRKLREIVWLNLWLRSASLDRVGDVALPQIDHEYRRKSMTPTPTSKSEVFGLIAKGNCFFALNSNQIGITKFFFKPPSLLKWFLPQITWAKRIFLYRQKNEMNFFANKYKMEKKEWIGKKGNEIKEVKACSLVPLMDKIYCPGSNWFQDISAHTWNLHMNILYLLSH